jgi:hypothetical protein
MTRRMSPQDPIAEAFHRLNNHLGIVLVNAELIEQRCPDAPTRTRAADVVAATLAALEAVKALRREISDEASKTRR